MTNMHSSLIEINLSSLGNQTENLNNHLMAKNRLRNHLLMKKMKMREKLRKMKIVISVSKKKLKCHQKNSLKLID